VAVAAVVDEADLGVQTFELAVEQSEVDRGQDRFAVLRQGSGQGEDRGNPAAAGAGEPVVEVGVGAVAGRCR
jgi:hypothetical protein